MTLPRTLIIGLILACTRHAVSQTASQAQAKQSAFVVSLRAEHDTFKAGSPIILEETLRNRSDHNVVYGRDVGRSGCPVDVLDESGKFAADRKQFYHHGRLSVEEAARALTPEQFIKSGLATSNFAWITLKPGEAWVETCDVSSFYDMTKPGVYKITVDFHDPDTASTIKSNQIGVTVTKPE